YWPDNDSVRTDLLDYAYEIEYFDQHLGQMLQLLQDAGELDNTLVVVTADNGMPFPRIKGQAYEMANHLPLAMRWPQGLAQPGRSVEAFVSFIDFAPTFLELAGVDPRQSGMQPITGLSLTDILYQQPHTDRPDYVLIGKERHDIGRPHDQGYPIRGIVKGEFLYLHNFEPDRWPAGNPETGYLNCDGSPTKTAVLQRRYHPAEQHYWQACFGKRPPEELYRISTDPHCTHNLAANLAYTETLQTLKSQLFAQLTAQQDPRMLGQGQLFDAYPYADQRQRGFYERYLAGEPLRAGWVNETDFQPE
ncbi:MAG: heparan N-sulfatase, partial [Bacteroidetes bacterium]